MQITYNDFVAVCPSAMTPDLALFDALQSAIDGQLAYLKNVCGDKVWSLIDADVSVLVTDYSPYLAALKQSIISYACNAAYDNSIPHLDLVLTSTGFGVVSNQNVAPASADRVKALRTQLHRACGEDFDSILSMLRYVTDVTALPTYYIYWHRLFWQAYQMTYFGIANPSRDDLIVNAKAITAGTERIIKIISEEQYDALMREEATGTTASELHKKMMHLLRTAVVSWTVNDGSFGALRDKIISLMEDNQTEFEQYINSSTYKALHSQRYQNQKDDTCYFFGGL